MRILIIEDDETSANLLGYLFSEKHETRMAASASDAVNIGTKWKPELIISDWDLKDGGDGVEACRVITREHPANVIITSGSPLASLEETAKLLSPWQVMSKPLQFDKLCNCVENLELHRNE